MIQFCPVCGSMMNNDHCTNKKCSLYKSNIGVSKKPEIKKDASSGTVRTVKAKSSYDKARRNSKCITYSIEELEKRQSRQ